MPKGGLQFWHLVVIVLLAAMLGTALGDILAQLFADGPVGRLLLAGVQVGTTAPWNVDIKVLQLTLGLSLRFTVLGTIGAAVALVVFFRRV
ncbi:MAG TPA: DUF4321 domain-containing protein [Candidatus Polarisedimenticolia bacterium]|nr:DUF4321 domain-containing protein [Candidatus Polarisedimenticolia bacterium]